jgi:hypothetical protein
LRSLNPFVLSRITIRKAAPVHLSVHPRAAGPGTVAVDFESIDGPTNATVDIAVVQHEAATDVRAGENTGRTLRHVNIVRRFAEGSPSFVDGDPQRANFAETVGRRGHRIRSA